jgi:Tol biopolymer transport system component
MKRKLLVLPLAAAILLSYKFITTTPNPQSHLFMLGVSIVSVNPQTGKTHQWGIGSYGVGVSPDGKRFAYATTDSSTTHIWVSDGSNARKIAEFPYAITSMQGCLTWSDDSRQIAFLHSKQLVILDVDTGKWQYIATPVTKYAWRPHSQQIAIFLTAGGMDSGLYLLDLTQQTRQHLGREYIRDIAWSPSGDQIAIATPSQDFVTEELVIIDVNSNVQRMIYSGTNYIDGLTWSPDGQSIMLRANYDKILLVDTSSREIRLVSDQAFYRGNVWSPDGEFIAYLKEDQETHDPFLVVFEVESDSERVLTTQVSPSVNRLVWR